MKYQKLTQVKQKGFTLIEIMVVLVIIGILAATWAATGFGAREDANFGVAKTYITNTTPTTIARYAMRTNGVCTSLTKAILTADPYDLDTDNVYGNSWSLTGAANSATMTYPTDAATTATSLASSIEAKGPINSISASGSNVSIQFSCG